MKTGSGLSAGAMFLLNIRAATVMMTLIKIKSPTLARKERTIIHLYESYNVVNSGRS